VRTVTRRLLDPVFDLCERLEEANLRQGRACLERLTLVAYSAGDVSLTRVTTSVRSWVNHVRYGNTVGLRKALFGVLYPLSDRVIFNTKSISRPKGKLYLRQKAKPMAETVMPQSTVIRTSRGLSIAGRRLTLYSIMDYLHAGWPPHLIRDEFNLTDQQITEVMEYIAAHRDEVEQEYHVVLQQAEDNRRYWEARNRQRLEHLAHLPPHPGHEQLRAKLQAVKARLGMA